MMAIFNLLFLMAFLGFLFLLIAKGPKNKPTWTGVIISLLLGLLIIYLILCWIGILGEKRNMQ